jgi:hypothetical protein
MESVHNVGVLVIHYVPVLLSKCQILNYNLRGQKSLGPLKMSLEMAHKVIVPPKKIISRSFLNSGTLIVKLFPAKESLVVTSRLGTGKSITFFTL